ncbi:MAG: hypothetical protein LUE61_01025 [Clostridiales bacterium]|nr:hypothetical protein [Clostridiales bacterium]
MDVLNEYIDTLTDRGATVWYCFCPMNALAVEEGLTWTATMTACRPNSTAMCWGTRPTAS